MKTYKYGDTEVSIQFTSYYNNDTLAVVLNRVSDGEFYCVITVNLDCYTQCHAQSKNTAYVDENNLPGIGKWLEDNGIATPTSIYADSGFCSYPLYKFNIDNI